MNSDSRPTRAFPDVGSLPETPAGHRVQLHYDQGDGRLIGTLGDDPMQWELVRYDHDVSGHIGAAGLEASWTTGNNYVPEPGGWTPDADYVSDFPNIPARLRGRFGDNDVELQGAFHLYPDYHFQRGSIVGRIGAVHLEATALRASGGLCASRTVVVEGTYGSLPFEVFATIDAGLSQGIVHGSVDTALVHLDLIRPSVQRSLPERPPMDFPGRQVFTSGSYDGPPELLAVIVGTMLNFL